MGKPTPGPTNNWSGGTPGNNTAVVASPSALKTTLYDAGAGYDTLDLSALTTGLSLYLSSTTQGNKLVTHSSLWADSPFHGGAYSWDQFSQVGTKTVESILNFEKVIGTGGNDYISSLLPTSYIDGGPGDDYVQGGSTTVGGLGSDLIGGGRAGDIFVGGTFDGAHATPDGTMDEFHLSAGTVLDFEVGIDRLYIDQSYVVSPWIDVTTSYGSGAQIHLTQPNDSRFITLVGVSAATMNAVPIGRDFGISAAQNTSGPGDDYFYDRYVTANTYNFGLNSGHDVIIGFDANLDTLVFPDTPTPIDTTYHGDPALLLTFGGGQSSVLLDGVTSADLSHIFMQYPTAALATHQVMSDYAILI